ncbi:hypothetical protein L7F22_049287 [Adiantum nelumboides]|nr:hypothetical protein [Adiantum nelumboides]
MAVSKSNKEVLPKPESLEEVIWQERDSEAQMTKVTRVREDDLDIVFLGNGEGIRPIYISRRLEIPFWKKLITLLREFQDVFAWEYADMKGLDPKFYQHKIHLKPDAVLVKQHSYRMNPNLAKQVKVEIDRLLQVGFITPIDNPEWISPIVVVPEKNKKIHICMDYRKRNAATVPDPYPLLFLDFILDDVAGHEMYSLLDGFSRYNQICMAQEDQAKIAFITAYGVFACTVMWFGLRNAPSTFQRDMFEIFGPYLTDYMRIFLDDLSVFGAQLEHLMKHPRLCFLKCREVHFSLNPLKCAFAVRSGRLLSHVISKDGIVVDPNKIVAIMEALSPINSKQCAIFLRQARWHGRNLSFVVHLAIPINYATHAKDFVWTSECDFAYWRLKIQLSKAPIMIPPN